MIVTDRDTRLFKNVKAGMKLWCVWDLQAPKEHTKGAPTFTADGSGAFRQMARDLLRLADTFDEIEAIWEDDDA